MEFLTLRTATVSLSNSQQLDLGPNTTRLVQKLLGLDESSPFQPH
jgi:hypothetical protein